MDRDQAATDVLLDALPDDLAGRRALIIDDPTGRVGLALKIRGARTTEWGRLASPWPPGGPFDLVTLRLPKEKDYFEMALHAAASVLRPGGAIWVTGANDEGIKSAARRMAAVFSEVSARSSRRHCRVLRGLRTAPPSRGRLTDWRRVKRITLPWAPVDWVSYPGNFAKGGLDPATAALLAVLPRLPAHARVLDFACGTGVLSAGVLQATPSARVDALDIDSLALAATRENVPSATTHLGARLSDLPAGRYDLIVSNPPIHSGKERSYTVLQALLSDAPARLAPKGSLLLVTQRQTPVRAARASMMWEDSRFRVWRLR